MQKGANLVRERNERRRSLALEVVGEPSDDGYEDQGRAEQEHPDDHESGEQAHA